MSFDFSSDELPIYDILNSSVYYPACAMDGRPVQYLGGYCHSFVYVDCNISCGQLLKNLEKFKGYSLSHSRFLNKEQLCFKPYQPIFPEPTDGNPRNLHVQNGFLPYSLWAIYDRLPEFDDTHGPTRFSMLFVGGEGVATFQSLYYSNQCSPLVVTLIKCDAFTGNWTPFFNPKKIFARSVMDNPFGTPDYIFSGYGQDNPPWPCYPNLLHTEHSAFDCDGTTRQLLRLWGRE
jgi:hypothetical protein